MVHARSAKPEIVCLVTEPRDSDCSEPAATERELAVALPAVEIGIPYGLPLPGSRTSQLKVVSERSESNRYETVFEAQGGRVYELPLRINRPGVQASGGEIAGSTLRIRFPAAEGYQRIKVTFTW